jgi:long-chain acyl-CoA synthetase
LVDVAELGYYAKDNAGEICVRGANVFRGYYKNEAETNAVMDKDGWLHTGDIGRWTERGTLKVVDRKKHIFKLAQGEYVAPEKIENIYSRSKYVAQSFIHGESLKTCLIGIVVPDPEVLPGAAAEKLGLVLSMEELCDRDDVKQMIIKDIQEVGKSAGLHSFEQVKRISRLAIKKFFLGQRHLLERRSIQRGERTLDTDAQIKAAPVERAL